MKLENLTIKEVCSCLAILNKLQEEEIVNIDLKTTRATINVDKTTEYLENQNEELQKRINKAIEYIKNNTYSSITTMKTILHLENDKLYDLLKILNKKQVSFIYLFFLNMIKTLKYVKGRGFIVYKKNTHYKVFLKPK